MHLLLPLAKAAAAGLLALWCWAGTLNAEPGAAASAPKPVAVTDDLGRNLVLAGPARRIVSLSPHITELLFEIGAGDLIVGADEYSDYPPRAKQIPRIGNSDNINYEVLLAQRPDLVIGWQTGNGMRHLQKLMDIGLPVFVNEPRRLGDIPATLLAFGQLTGRNEAAMQHAQAFKAEIQQLAGRYRNTAPVSVFYQVWNEPLITLNGRHILSDLIQLCGGRNVFAELPSIAPRVSIEAVLQANPQVIISGSADEHPPAWLYAWRTWPSLAAVREEHLYFVSSDITQRHSSRILQGAAQICERLDRVRG